MESSTDKPMGERKEIWKLTKRKKGMMVTNEGLKFFVFFGCFVFQLNCV